MFGLKKRKQKRIAKKTVNVGTPEFDNQMFVLTHPVTKDNIQMFNYKHFVLHHYSDSIYLMPVYISHQANIFMIISPRIFSYQWTVSFCPGRINADHEIIDLQTSQAVTTGRGLNILGAYSPKDANQMLRYFNGLAQLKKGSWHKIIKPAKQKA